MEFKYTQEQLNSLDHELLVQLFLGMQEQLEKLTAETSALNEKMQAMMEQIVLANKNRFGRSCEKMQDTEGQICFMEIDGKIVFFNEAEAVSNLDAAEPEELENKPHRGTKTKGKRAHDMEVLPTQVINHYLSQEELISEFGENGWKQLPDTIVKKYHFTPAKITVDEHHIGVYASKTDEHMKKAPHPAWLLKGSPVTQSLAAAVVNGKYVNAVPLYRLEQEFKRYGLAITRQNMANWIIRIAEEYFGIIYDFMHIQLYGFHVIQADETPVLVNRDGRAAGSSSYMWVYRSGFMYTEKQIVLYDYHKTRNGEHPRNFLREYSGICVTDGYSVYHSLDNEKEDLTVAGCWTHCRRKFNDALQVIPKQAQKGTMSYLAMKQIQAIYREEGKLKELDADDRLKQRQAVIKPLVDAFFAYIKSKMRTVGTEKLMKACTYAVNQEKYLRVFLSDGEVPIDNNASERAIKGFCIGRKNWQMIDTINGAKASAIVYSIVETAKANNVKPYEYVEYILTELLKHMDDTDRSFLEDLMPWSENLPEYIRKAKSR